MELRTTVELMSEQVQALEGDRDKALFVAKELRKFVEEMQAENGSQSVDPSHRYSGWAGPPNPTLEMQVARQEKLLVASNSAVLRGLQVSEFRDTIHLIR